MTPIKITSQNEAKIEAALKEINGKATSFTITSYAGVEAFVVDAERQLAMLPKKDQVGASAFCMPAGPSANSYKYGAKSTSLRIERRASGWFLAKVVEEKVYPKSPEKCCIKISKAQAEEIQKRAISSFLVME